MNKKSIKKLTALLCMAALLSFSFIACGSSDDKKNNNATNGPSLSPTGGSDGAAGTDAANDDKNGTGTGTAGTDTATTDTPVESPKGENNGGPITGAKAGTYTATAKGYASDITVTVTVDDKGKVKKVDADAAGETETIGQVAAPQICDKVVETQSLDVDTVSGATYTSTAVMTAIKDALSQAGVDTTAVNK